MFDEHDGTFGMFHVQAEIILPLVVIVTSLFFAFFSFFYTEAPRAVVREESHPDSYVAVGEFEYGTPTSEAPASSLEVVSSRPQATPTVHASEAWVVSSNPSTFYVVQQTEVYACPSYDCEVVASLFPGVYWELPFTLTPDGWFETRHDNEEQNGYVAVARLSAEMPGHCRLVLPYRIGHVSQRFLDEGFDAERLRAIILETEKEIEDVVGRNVLQYDDSAENTINFVISHYNDAEPGHRGLHTSTATFPNGTNGQFWVGVYAALFDDVERWRAQQYIGAQHVEPFKENYMRKTILHEMVHTLGFGHLEDQMSIMCGAPGCQPIIVDLSSPLTLTGTDTAAIVEWCE